MKLKSSLKGTSAMRRLTGGRTRQVPFAGQMVVTMKKFVKKLIGLKERAIKFSGAGEI